MSDSEPESSTQRYHNALRLLRERQHPDSITVRFPWQCKIAFLELIELAIRRIDENPGSHVIRIITGKFPWKVYVPPVGDSLVKYLELGGKLKVLVWNDELGDSQKLVDVLARQTGRFECRLAHTKESASMISHIFVVDDIAYRIEAPHSPFDGEPITDVSPIVPSRICFNDRSSSAKLAEYFESLWGLFADRSSLSHDLASA